MWRGRVGCALLGLVAALSAALSRAAEATLPECTFEACPVCLPNARTSVSNLTIFGPDERYHQAPLRIGRGPALWDSQSVYAQIVGILASEQLGIQVEYVPVMDDSSCWFAVNNCIGWQDYTCDTWDVQGDAGLARKMYGDVLADIMFAVELESATLGRGSFEGTELDYDSRPSINLGPSGYTVTESLFAPLDIVARGRADGVDLRWFPSYELPRAKSYFDVPQRLMDDGVVPQRVGCWSDISLVQSGMDSLSALGFTCNNSWWLTPACAGFADKWTTECMVMIDDDWGYLKPELYAALAGSQAPIAKLTVGYDMWDELTTVRRYNITHNWWQPDASLALTAPQFVRMPWETETKADIRMKAAWGPALEADPKVNSFLSAVLLRTLMVEDLMKGVAAAYDSGLQPGGAVFQKIACDWLRAREDVWMEWMPSAKSCLPGQVFDDKLQHCVACPRGTYAAAHKQVCFNCTAGTFTQVEGALQCSACIPGQFSAVTGASTGEVCQRCPQGTFASWPGRSGCEACNATFTTLFPGAIKSSDCTCAEGFFLQLTAEGDENEAFCAHCVKGLVCPGDRQRPLQATGFAATVFTVGGPKAIVACGSDLKCPGGTPLGTCPDHHEGVACDVCAAGYFEQDGRCAPCKGRNPAFTIVPLAALLVAGGGLVARAARSRVGVGTSSAVTLVLTCSLTVSTLQMMTSFEKLLRNWPEPLATLYNGLRFFTVDLNVIGLSCVVRLGHPEIAYLGSLMLHPTFAAVLFLSVWGLRLRGWNIPFDEVVNMQGLVVMAVYIALTIVSLRPWQCDLNPDGTASVATSRAVICWSTHEHRLMIGLSVIALFVYVVGAFALVSWATWVYPRKIHTSGGEAFIRRYRFLYFRFKAQHYAFVIPFMIRSVLVSVLPVVLVNETSMCVMFLILVVGSGCAVQCWIQPWREVWINYLDALSSLCILLLLTGGALVMNTEQQHTEQMVKYFYMSLIMGLGTCLLGVALGSIWRWLFPHATFGVFLCHHKDGAAVLARWFKMLLTEWTTERVFLDSDELDRLDKIFEVVARETKYMVLLLTEQTMQRIWCAGEMATAVRYKVETFVVACGDYQPPTDDFIDRIAKLWTEEQQNQAFALGVCIQDIQDAYRAIRDMPALALDRELPMVSQELVVHRLFEKCSRLRGTPAGQMHRLRFSLMGCDNSWHTEHDARKGQGFIAIAGDMEDPEAAAACAVLARLLAREMASVVTVLERGETSLACYMSTQYLLAALSRSVLRNAAFAATLVDAEVYSLECIPVIADSQFRVPGAAFWQAPGNRSTDEWPQQVQLDRYEVLLEDVISTYRRLFNVLAMRFSTYGSARIQAAEVKELVPRFCRDGDKLGLGRVVTGRPAATSRASELSELSSGEPPAAAELKEAESPARRGSGGPRRAAAPPEPEPPSEPEGAEEEVEREAEREEWEDFRAACSEPFHSNHV